MTAVPFGVYTSVFTSVSWFLPTIVPSLVHAPDFLQTCPILKSILYNKVYGLWFSVPPVFAFPSFVYSDFWLLKFPSSAQVHLILTTLSGSRLRVPWLKLLLQLPSDSHVEVPQGFLIITSLPTFLHDRISPRVTRNVLKEQNFSKINQALIPSYS